MKKIFIRNLNEYSLVDDEDYDRLMEFHWSGIIKGKHRYAETRRNYILFPMHRLILNPSDGQIIDHRNQNGLDNRKSNLRVVTRSQNGHNVGLSKANKSGYRGVTRCTQTGQWKARFVLNKKEIWLGRFDTKEEAGQVRKDYESRVYKELLC